MLISGLDSISNEIESKLEENDTMVVELTNLEFAETDFQPEGLYYSIAKWASESFDFHLQDYKIEFDQEENRYNFPEIRLRKE